MKVCVIFRGENERHTIPYEIDLRRKYINAIMCWNNWKEKIYDDLINNDNECDIAFITYQSQIIDEIKTVINPKYLILKNQTNQITNFNDVLQFMKEHTEYDRFVILRCDFRYRINITNWPKWKENGIFILNRDVHWSTTRFCGDCMFMVDSNSIDIFSTAFYSYIHCDSMHAITVYLFNNNIPFHLMYNEYYHMGDHPLASMASLEDEIDMYKDKGDQRVLIWNNVVLS